MDARRNLILAAAGLALAGCATVPEDGGLGAANALVGKRVPQAATRAWTDAERARVAATVRERLAAPLQAEDAAAIAILNTAALQAQFAELGIAEADLVPAGRLRNPGFTYTRLKRGSEREIERSFTFDLVGLVTMPWRLEAERAMAEGARYRTAMAIVRAADEARAAWVEAVAAAELAAYAARVNDAAAAGAELAREMARAGNFNRLAQSREHLFHAEAVANLARSRHAAAAARERLARALGLWGEDLGLLTLPQRLPDPPDAAREIADAQATAVAQRLDVQAARGDVDATVKSLGLPRVTRFVNVLHLGYERNHLSELTEDGRLYAPRQTGYELELEIPIFDWGDAKAARAEAVYRQSASRLAEVAVRARSEVREAYSAYRTAHDLARHYRAEIVPLRNRIAEENLLRYNGMLIGVFELLADARSQVAAVMAAIEANRDFWIAQANLETALATGSPAGGVAMKSNAPAAAPPGGH